MNSTKSIPPKPAHVEAHHEDDLVVVWIRGAYDGAAARYLEFIYVNQVQHYGYRLVLIHANETTTITPEARRLMSEWNAARRDAAVGAVVGASFTAKTIAMMLVRAFSHLTKLPAELGFFDSEAEARAWLDQQRIKLQATIRKK